MDRHIEITCTDEENTNSCSGTVGMAIAITPIDAEGHHRSDVVMSTDISHDEASSLAWLTISHMLDEWPATTMEILHDIADMDDGEIREYFASEPYVEVLP